MNKMLVLCGFLFAGVISSQTIVINSVAYEVERLYELSDDEKQELRQPVLSKINDLKDQCVATDDISEKVRLCNEIAAYQNVLNQLASSDSYVITDYGNALLS